MPSETGRDTCVDCGGALERIKVVARSSTNPLSGFAHDCETVYYTGVDRERSRWMKMFDPTGTVVALRCVVCGRILWYGHPLRSRASRGRGSASRPARGAP